MLNKFRLSITSALLLSATTALGSESVAGKGFGGAMLGYTTVTTFGSGLTYGINTGYFLSDEWGVGIFLQSGNIDNGGSTFTLQLEGLYNLSRFADGLYVGGMFGATKFSGASFTGAFNFSGGAKIGYDYKLQGSLPVSVGGELDFLWMSPVGTTVTQVSPMAVVKIWF